MDSVLGGRVRPDARHEATANRGGRSRARRRWWAVPANAVVPLPGFRPVGFRPVGFLPCRIPSIGFSSRWVPSCRVSLLSGSSRPAWEAAKRMGGAALMGPVRRRIQVGYYESTTLANIVGSSGAVAGFRVDGARSPGRSPAFGAVRDHAGGFGALPPRGRRRPQLLRYACSRLAARRARQVRRQVSVKSASEKYFRCLPCRR